MPQYISKRNFCLNENALHLHYKEGTLEAIQQNTLRLLRASQGLNVTSMCYIYFHLYFELLNVVLLPIFIGYTFRMVGYVWMVKFRLVEESSNFPS